jgi:hypothetical protein
MKRELMARLEQDAQRICLRFRLRYRALEAERANVKSRYGVCFSDGTIRIRLRHATTGAPLKYSSLVNTLCHELAHLRHFNHGPRFQTLYGEILEWARREGIYRPRERSTAIAATRTVPFQAGVAPAASPRAAANAAPPRRRQAVLPTSASPVQLDLFG